MDNAPQKIITIDGPAGVGKSTVAGIVADKLQISWLNTGAMFRALALHMGDAENLTDDKLRKRCQECHFSLAGAGKNSLLLCDGKPLGDEIRAEKIGLLASKLAANPIIRSCLLKAQQEIGAESPLVAEGRDMGTVVFPLAAHKFFLDATPGIRAHRRFLQLQAKGQHPDLAKLEQEIQKRDEQDRNRPIAPLVPAPDAMIIDTSHLSIDQVVDRILQTVEKSAS